MYKKYGIKSPKQICNLEDNGFKPGLDLCGARSHRVVKSIMCRAVIPRALFREPQISHFVAIFGNGNSLFQVRYSKERVNHSLQMMDQREGSIKIFQTPGRYIVEMKL